MRYFLTIILAAILHFPLLLSAQPEFSIGDTLVFGKCSGSSYAGIDLYTKTRFEPAKTTWDERTGANFYNFWFGTGDFDVARLPCTYRGKKCELISAQDFSDSTGTNVRTVLFCRINKTKVVWIEPAIAFEKGEIYRKEH